MCWFIFSIIVRCNHNKTSQKRCQMMKNKNQNWKNIYVLSFKTMASCFFLIPMNVKEFFKNPFDKNLSLSFIL